MIVVDDGSSPPLTDLVGDLPLCRVVRSVRAGAAAARNQGIDGARGDHVAFLDSDDVFLPGKLASVAQALADDPAAVVYSRVAMDYGHGLLVPKPTRPLMGGERMPEYLLAENELIATPSLVVPTALARAVLWDESLGYGDDSDFIIRLWWRGAKFRFIPDVLVRCDMAHGMAHLSGGGDATRMERWLRDMREVLGPRTELCYRATHLLALRGRVLCWAAIRDASRAVLGGHVMPAAVAGSIARGLLPTPIYRFAHRCWLRRPGRRPTGLQAADTMGAAVQ